MGFCTSSLSALQKTNRESRYMHGISQMKQLNVIQTSIFQRSNNIISIIGIKRKGTQLKNITRGKQTTSLTHPGYLNKLKIATSN